MDKMVAGAYTLEVNNKGIYIAGDNEAGVFYGIQTLIQLLPPQAGAALAIPYISITDYPRFGYRGMMLDVGRHFFPVDFVKKNTLIIFALHKMNYFPLALNRGPGLADRDKKISQAYRSGRLAQRHHHWPQPR